MYCVDIQNIHIVNINQLVLTLLFGELANSNGTGAPCDFTLQTMETTCIREVEKNIFILFSL